MKVGETISEHHVLDLLYGAALDRAQWLPFLKALQAWLTVSFAQVYLKDLSGGAMGFWEYDGLSAEAMNLYHQHYFRVDINLSAKLSLPLGTITATNFLITEKAFQKTEFYNDFSRHHGIFHQAGVLLSQADTHTAAFGTCRPKALGPYQQREIRKIGRLIPHLNRALSIHRQVGDWRDLHRGFEEALDRIPQGTVLLDARGAIIYMNRHASEILQSNCGLEVRGNEVVSKNPEAELALRRLVLGAIATGNNMGADPGGSLEVPHASGVPSYQVMVSPLGSSNIDLGFGRHRACAIMFIVDPRIPIAFSHTTLHDLFGFTPTECRVAVALCNGQTPDQIGLSLKASVQTVRTHMRAVFEKAAVHRQSELAKLLLMSPAPLAAAGSTSGVSKRVPVSPSTNHPAQGSGQIRSYEK